MPSTCGSGGAEKGSQQEEAGLDSLLPVLFLTSSVKYSGHSDRGALRRCFPGPWALVTLGGWVSDSFKSGSGNCALASVTTVGEDLVVGGAPAGLRSPEVRPPTCLLQRAS